jgi:hypothetical protein
MTILDDDFARFWHAYPKRKAKKEACKAWGQLKPTTELVEQMLQALDWQRHQPEWMKSGGQFVPLPATWLRGERWTDEKPAPTLKGTDIAAEQQQKMQVLHTLLAQGVARPEALRRAGF